MAGLRCLYQRAVDDGLMAEADNPARKVTKPRRLPATRRELPDTRLAEINQAAAATGDDPELDTLLLRLHACQPPTRPLTATQQLTGCMTSTCTPPAPPSVTLPGGGR